MTLEGISSINRAIPIDLCFLNSFINKHQGKSKHKYCSQVSHPQLNSITESVCESSPDEHSFMYKRPMGHIINLCWSDSTNAYSCGEANLCYMYQNYSFVYTIKI